MNETDKIIALQVGFIVIVLSMAGVLAIVSVSETETEPSCTSGIYIEPTIKYNFTGCHYITDMEYNNLKEAANEKRIS